MRKNAKPNTSQDKPEDVPTRKNENRLMLVVKPHDLEAIADLRTQFAAEGVILSDQKTVIAAVHQLRERRKMEAARREQPTRKPLRNR